MFHISNANSVALEFSGNVINTFLNENAKEIFDEVRPQIGSQVAEMVSLLANRALANLPAEQFMDIPDERFEEA